jgi:hypothetical protein
MLKINILINEMILVFLYLNILFTIYISRKWDFTTENTEVGDTEYRERDGAENTEKGILF